MQLEAGCQLLFETIAPSPLILMLKPRSGLGQQVIQADCRFQPQVPVVEYIDSYGNLCQRLIVPEGPLQINATAIADVSDHIDVQPGAAFVPVQAIPDYALQFLLPSRY